MPEIISHKYHNMLDNDTLHSMKHCKYTRQTDRDRRQAISRQLSTKEYPYTLSIFPRLGTPDALNGVLKRKMENSNVNDSTSVPDGVVSTESRYQAAEKNIPARREDQQRIKVHKYQDKNTDGMPVLLEGTIFGPGHCGLQATFQASDEIEARLLHDQFIPLGPIMLALTASTPIYGGYLTDTDARWNQISQAVDDRLDHEVDQMTNGASVDLPQRWFCNTTYLSNDPRLKEEYQLKNLATNDEAYKKLTEAGLDPLISRHFAHIFVRDPIMISESDANSHDPVAKHHTNVDLNTNHFESLNGTVWPHVRLKIPPHDDSNIGWRVEFRAMETQLTDFENGAFCIFMALVRRVITAYDLNFYMPLEKVQENMDLAHERDAVTTQKFEFRSEVIPSSDDGVDREEFERLSVDEIINGGARFKGLLPFIYRFLGEQDVDEKVSRALKPYLDLVSSRASGRLWTAARWMREYVRSHEEYREDSYVNPQVCYDMMKRIRGLIEGDRRGCGMFQQTP